MGILIHIIRISILCSIVFIPPSYGQVGGSKTYSFLDLTPSAQVAALGGKVNAIPGSDPSLAFYNPGLLDSTANNSLSLNFVDLFAGIGFGYVAYSRSYQNAGNFGAGIHYVNYGNFTEAGTSGVIDGTFFAHEYAINLTYSRSLPWFDSTLLVGVNLKPLISVFETYHSYGLLGDFGLTYRHPNRLFMAALVLRNVGGQIKPYSDGGREPVPFELQLGLSQKLEYAPFRISLILQRLEQGRMSPNKVNLNPAAGQNPVTEDDLKKGFDLVLDEVMRRVLIGVECYPFQGLTIRAGYNYNRRQEMKIENRPALVGLSFGLGIQLSRIHVNYARSVWHLAGASDHFSVNVSFN